MVIEVDMNATLADFVSERRRKKVKIAPRKNIEKGRKREVQEDAAAEEISSPPSAAEDQKVFDVSPGITVSLFDYSIDNHFRAIDTICRLSGEPRSEDIEQIEIERMSSSVTFLREWRHFNYQPRVLRFACQNENSPHGKNVSGEITLPQFSAATVPKNNEEDGNSMSFDSRKDFVMNVGGLVWALDWCPGVHQKFDSHIKCEFIAVGAHPPESFYHKIGGPLVGRGLIQIWCLLNSSDKEEEASQEKEKPKKKTSNKSMMKVKSSQANRPRGRPRKNPTNISVDNSNDNNPYVQALAVQFPENSSNLHLMDMVSRDTDKHAKRLSSRKNKGCHPGVDADNLMLTSPPSYGENLPMLSQNESVACCQENPGTCSNSELELEGCSMSILKSCNSESRAPTNVVPKDVALPRVVLCLAHNGKVAWDVKWQPSNGYDKEAKHRIGHLAVLLGNGALEVWEVPSPQTVKAIYSEHRKDGTDPRFVKLEPIFRCSKLKFGDRQSIPLTLEWSASAPHDLILAGCHDGVVALWKFSANCTSEDTRPLLCFSADTVPIRALAWAPTESDPESANVVVTAGHKGLKFWDIRDPFRPLWDLNPVQRNIYSLDWLPNPGCVIVSFDDGTLRILSLMKAAYDVPVTGKPFVGTQQQGFHSYFCSSFAIWSVQVSRLTGMVAYCSTDGAVLHFQLTHRAVEKDPLRNRAPHFLCGSLSEEESAFTVINPQPNTPFPMKKSLNEWASAPRTIRGFLCVSNQAKRAKEQMEKGETSDDQTPSLCYGDDPRTESESEDLMVSQKNRPITKPKANTKRKGKSELALACRDEESDHVERGDDGKGEVRDEKIEKFPPKMVAMHSVRWNMNKGSERWLCYGGAAGIVRCREIERP